VYTMERTSKPELEHAIDRDLEREIHASGGFSEAEFLANSKAPSYLPHLEKQVSQFLDFHKDKRQVAIVTSGGTTVPLENNTVRFIDNFSGGTRGSVSAEWLIDHGYAVVFLHREFSLMPYSHKYSTHSALDLMEVVDGKLRVKAEYERDLLKDVARYQEVKSQNLLLGIPFTTIHQYLHTLRMIGVLAKPHGSAIMFYLAAAVSDFFLPMSKMSEHKIQSHGAGKLVIDLDPVPKFLRSLSQEWTSSAFIVSFKLETDPKILMDKCHGALEKYGHQLVVGNLLQTRKDEVFLVTPTTEDHIRRDSTGTSIEDVFLPKVIDLHQKFIKEHRG